MASSTLKGTVYGAACGDALGVPYEFKDRGTFYCDGTMIGFGTHHQPAGTWSDDTSMTIALCDSIRRTRTIDVEDILFRFKRWLFEGKYACGGIVFDYGLTTYKAIHLGKGIDRKTHNGNGSLMRIAPLAYINWSRDCVYKVSSITHAHKISKDTCYEYVLLLRSLIDGTASREKLIETFSNLANAPSRQIRSGGFVIDTLKAALWCFITTDNYEDCVIKAVNLGGDTDTTAAVAGALAGTYYGYEAIPQSWIDTLRDKKIIDDCLFDPGELIYGNN